MRRALPLLVLLLGEGAAVVALHRLGQVPGLAVPFDDMAEWLRNTAPQDAVAAVLRLVALVLAWWQLASTLAYLAVRITRSPRSIRAAGRATLPFARWCVERAVAVSFVAGTVLTPSVASAAPPDVRTGRADQPVVATASPVDPPAAAPFPTATTYAVTAGDNLWTIAARHLASTTGRDVAAVPDVEVAPYWARLCDANRDRISSRNVDLIYPGETIVLPPI